MKGSCLCGSIEVIAEERDTIDICHCTMCRKWTSGPYFAVDCGTHVDIKGDTLGVYQSTEWAERGFCNQCGTHLFYHLLPTHEYMMSAGLFEHVPFILKSEVFIDEKPEFYEFKNDTHKMTAQQVFDLFDPKK